MPLSCLNPLLDPRWAALVASHPSASVFHEPAWLRALAETYGYPSFAITTGGADEAVQDGMVFCEVRSWITGARAVSLPFSDHVQPLLADYADDFCLQPWMAAAARDRHWMHMELRVIESSMTPCEPAFIRQRFCLHLLDLSPPLERLFQNLNRDCMQRRIRHAERIRLCYERSSSPELIPAFYKLLTRTRARHKMPPQPRAWFENLMTEFGSRAEIRLVRMQETPIAAIFTLRHRGTVTYKYGCSDERFHHLAAIPLLLWKLIEESKVEGTEQIDLGRTELDQEGLLRFKDHLGARRRTIAYIRYPFGYPLVLQKYADRNWLRTISTLLPSTIVSTIGRRFYRHAG